MLPILSAFLLFNVRDFGAKGDGFAKDTAAIQAALDRASASGGGVVSMPAGTYLAGTIHLRSNVTVELTGGAVLKMSADNGDFDPYETLSYNTHSDRETSFFHHALLAGEDVESIAITGRGRIDANRTRRGGPKPIALKRCRHVSVTGITIENAPNYAISLLGCDYVNIDGVSILNAYADGIDPDCSRFVRISNSYIDSSDDCIVPKSSFALGEVRATEGITVTNCVTRGSANHFKLGTESGGVFRNITVSNMAMYPRPKPFKRDEAGIAVDVLDGGRVEGLTVSNIAMHDVRYPLFIRLGTRVTGPKPYSYGSIEDISISNVVATGSDGTATISGLPGHNVKNVMLDGFSVVMKGGIRSLRGLEIPEEPTKYAEPNMFGERPAYGLYARHVDGLRLRGFSSVWSEPDLRPAAIFDDVADLNIDGFRTSTVEGSEPVLWLNNVRSAFLGALRAPVGPERLMRTTGSTERLVWTDRR
jgi:polygalacturonase